MEAPDLFERQLNEIVDRWHPIGLPDLLGAMARRGSLPKRAVLLTFDDGDRSVLDTAMPLLEQRGVPGIALVVANHLDSDRPFWWEEVQILVGSGVSATGVPGHPAEAVRVLKRLPNSQRVKALEDLRGNSPNGPIRSLNLSAEELLILESAGIMIGNHSLTHPCLTRCTQETMQREIEEAHKVLAEALGHPPDSFAYPDGDRDPRAESLLREIGYQAGFLFDHRRTSLPVENPLAISRLRVDSDASLNRFRLILSGLHPTLHHLRGGQ